jgi:hypothetical protein
MDGKPWQILQPNWDRLIVTSISYSGKEVGWPSENARSVGENQQNSIKMRFSSIGMLTQGN